MKLLNQGDVIILKKGYMVYVENKSCLPEWFPSNELCVGQVYHKWEALKEGEPGYDPDYLKKKYDEMRAPDYRGFRGIIGASKECAKIVDTFDSSILCGPYLVINTVYGGGGSQTCPSSGMAENWPDGHRVFCKQFVNNEATGIEVSFYQSGCFTCMITEDIEIAGSEISVPCTQDHHVIAEQLLCNYCPQCGVKLHVN